MTMLIVTETLALPNTLLTTVGMVEKKAPFAAPLIITNTISGASVVDAGHMANMVMAVRTREAANVLSGPNLSQATPDAILPTADARLKPATRLAPTLEVEPRDFVYSGMKNGGTKSGNVPRALPRKTRLKLRDLKSRLWMLVRWV